MSTPRTVLGLDIGLKEIMDISRVGHTVKKHGNVVIEPSQRQLRLQGPGYLNIGKSESLSKLDDFTVEVAFAADQLGANQQILEGDSLPVSISLDRTGKIIGGVYTDEGWETVDSGTLTVRPHEDVRVRLVYSPEKRLKLEINDRHANEAQTKGKLVRQGNEALTIGTKLDKRTDQFKGKISGVRVLDKAIDAIHLTEVNKRARDMAVLLKRQLNFTGNIIVELDPDTVDHRFDSIRAILNAAGVEDLSQLDQITIDRPTVIQPNTMMIAPRKNRLQVIDWAGIATLIANADIATAVLNTATVLPNRHSTEILQNQSTAGAMMARTDLNEVADLSQRVPDNPTRLEGKGKSLANRVALNVNLATLKSPASQTPFVRDLIRPAGRLEIVDKTIFEQLTNDQPADWPIHAQPKLFMMTAISIPVDTSVIIAGRLDLTNQRLVIEPTVKALYIIAEEIVGDTNASITWRRPGGSTPARTDDPGKNGRSYSGVHTAQGSRNGLRGEDGRDGDPGVGGQDGLDAPNLEVWVKHLTAMPDIDLNGENGIKGGRGQRGGRGGNGARGETGKWWWFFGVHCWESPGHGGNGGDGGRGGRGGPGGDGGRGGNISIGVLEGTLASSVTARQFKIKNQGGQPGRGGDGGPGGQGGVGGTHGNDYVDGQEVCGNGVDGTHGSQGQPGPVGADGRLGQDGTLRFFEFTEESWNEQLTRPWLYEVTPHQAFPGNTLTITGTRFADADRVIIGNHRLIPHVLPDESIEVTLPTTIEGGEKTLYVQRFDGVQSNALRFWVKPQLHALTEPLLPNQLVTLHGEAFLAGASVLYDGTAIPAQDVTRTSLRFRVPGMAAGTMAEQTIRVAIRNPDSMVSNERTVNIPGIIDSGLKVDVHGLSFGNFAVGSPSWGTFEETFGALEVWHELLDPIFGHPLLTGAFFAFYSYFLKGKDAGGLATGFCTSLSAKVLDEFWTGSTDTFTRVTLNDALRSHLTAIHGRLLSRESLLDFHDQGRRGNANVLTSFRAIEANLRDGGDRESALMLFFVPSGEFWDQGYFDRLGDSHCIVPYRIVYPIGYDGTSIAGAQLFCWDCNHPFNPSNTSAQSCRLVFRSTDGEILFDYFDGGNSIKFSSEQNITLATMSLGKYLLSDHDMPFSGPFGLTTFVLDFLLSPADLLIENSTGQQTGLQGTSIVAEIPDSHPAYLAKGAYLLPANEALTRRITGSATGSYAYQSIAPNGVSLSLEGISTTAGQVDILAANADGTSVRFTPGTSKNFTLNLARDVGGEVRNVSIVGAGGGPTSAMDLNLSPDLSIVRVSNTDTPWNVDVQVSQIIKATGGNAQLKRSGVGVPINHDLAVTVTDWADLALTVRVLPFS